MHVPHPKSLLAVLVLLLTLAPLAAAQGVSVSEPIVITPAGQSADGTLVRVALQRAGFGAEVVDLLQPEGLEGVGTLVLALGGSQKGLGAAGIDIDAEVARTNALLDAAEAAGIPVIGVHVGGEARRGPLSEPFIQAAAPRVDALLVTEDGNGDGYFTSVAEDGGIPLQLLPNVLAVGDALGALGQGE